MSIGCRLSELLVEELESILDKLLPEEADLSAVHVWDAPCLSRSRVLWMAFGPAGGGLFASFGPRLLTIIIAIVQGSIGQAALPEVKLELELISRRISYSTGERRRPPFESKNAATAAINAHSRKSFWTRAWLSRLSGGFSPQPKKL